MEPVPEPEPAWGGHGCRERLCRSRRVSGLPRCPIPGRRWANSGSRGDPRTSGLRGLRDTVGKRGRSPPDPLLGPEGRGQPGEGGGGGEGGRAGPGTGYFFFRFHLGWPFAAAAGVPVGEPPERTAPPPREQEPEPPFLALPGPAAALPALPGPGSGRRGTLCLPIGVTDRESRKLRLCRAVNLKSLFSIHRLSPSRSPPPRGLVRPLPAPPAPEGCAEERGGGGGGGPGRRNKGPVSFSGPTPARFLRISLPSASPSPPLSPPPPLKSPPPSPHLPVLISPARESQRSAASPGTGSSLARSRRLPAAFPAGTGAPWKGSGGGRSA